MKRTLDPKRNLFKPVNPVVVRPVQNTRGKMPLRMGEVILADHEKEVLNKLGYKPGMELPGDLAAKLRATQHRLDEEVRTLKPKSDDFVPDIPEETDINDLSPAQQEKMRRCIAEFQRQAPQLLAEEMSFLKREELTPGVRAALDEANDGAKNLQDMINEVEGKTSNKKTDLVEEAPVVEDGISFEDKANYISSVMSGAPFTKRYSLLGGSVILVMRCVPQHLAEGVLSHAAHAVSVGADEATVERDGKTLLTLLSIDTVKTKEQTLNIADMVDEFLKKDDVSIDNMFDEFTNSELYKNHTLWGLCQKTRLKFMSLVDIMEERADDSDFWKPTAG